MTLQSVTNLSETNRPSSSFPVFRESTVTAVSLLSKFTGSSKAITRTAKSLFPVLRIVEKEREMAEANGVSSRDDVVIKAPNDRRLYRILTLPNGLTALLVHDPEIFPDSKELGTQFNPKNEDAEDEDDEDEDEEEDDDDEDDDDDDEDEDEDDEDDDDDEEGEDEDEENERKKKKNKTGGDLPTKKAAVAMCVGMGSFADPDNAQGLAHFLEHMLFMGSSEYPDENEYDSYLSKHGGSSNAFTETEFTCYHFEVNREYLKESMKRFSQFFISPLVKSEALQREVLAVDSEFRQVLQNDGCRLQQLQCHTSPPDHPFNRFFWGNKKSLIDAMENGVNLREKILHFYEEYYHGGLMKLVVIGGESLDTLEEWVIELFSKVKKGDKYLTVKTDGRIWEYGKIYSLEAVKDLHEMQISWPLPCLRKDYLKKPEAYLAHLIGHEAKGSLLSYLKAKGWASSLSAGVGEGVQCSPVAYIFVLCIRLTDSGFEKVLEVISAVYQYLKLLRKTAPQKWVFDELQAIGKMDFRFAEEQPQDDYAAELAENSLLYPAEHIIYGDYAYEVWDERMIEYVLSFFRPDNMRIDVLSKLFNKHSLDVKVEPWFGSQYVEEAIPSGLLNIWKEPAEIDPLLHLPLKNDFIPSDFSICSDSENHEIVDLPRCIIDGPKLKIWYKLDQTFNVPRANTYFLISVKDSYSSPRNCVLTLLFMNLLKDELNETLYQASVAKLDTSLCIVGDRLELRFFGFNEKLPILLSKILLGSSTFHPKADRFKVIKEELERAFKNNNMKPLNHSSYLRLQVLREKFWHDDDKLCALNDISLHDLETFIPKLFSQLYIEGICHGNLLEKEAINISDIFVNKLCLSSLPDLPVETRHQERVLCLPAGASYIRNASVKNDSEVNSVVELYFQVEQDEGSGSTRSRAIADLFSDILEEPFFNQLRTKEQLGYVVRCGPRMTYRVLGFCFCVQSSEYSPVYLQGRIDHFIEGVPKLLEELDEESFESHRSGLIAEKIQKDPSLTYETGHYWGQIIDKRYMFDMLKKEAMELQTIQKNEIIQWYSTYINRSSPKCRRLAIHLWGCNTDFQNDGAEQAKYGTVIDDLSTFKASNTFYPSLC